MGALRACYALVALLALGGTILGSHLVSVLTADNVKQIDTSSIPAAVLAAVTAEKPNGVITGAEFENEAGVDMYEITVAEGGVEYEIDVSPTGEILDVAIDDDSDDEIMLKVGWALVIGSPASGLIFAACVFLRSKQARNKDILLEAEGNASL